MEISKNIINKWFDYGKKEEPIEACGYLAGKNDKIVKFYPMQNQDKSREHFTFDPQEQFDVMKKIRTEGLEILAVYHTHPSSPARPSREDIKLAYDPEVIQVIASLFKNNKCIRAFKIINEIVNEEELIIKG